VDPRSALKLKSLQVIERFGVPDETVLNRILKVRERLYACCDVFEEKEA